MKLKFSYFLLLSFVTKCGLTSYTVFYTFTFFNFTINSADFRTHSCLLRYVQIASPYSSTLVRSRFVFFFYIEAFQHFKFWLLDKVKKPLYLPIGYLFLDDWSDQYPCTICEYEQIVFFLIVPMHYHILNINNVNINLTQRFKSSFTVNKCQS